jgi:hypothetical protein
LNELHAALPHLQAIVLIEELSTLIQGSPLEQVLVEDVQNKPDVGVQPVFPHKQGAPLEMVPSV